MQKAAKCVQNVLRKDFYKLVEDLLVKKSG